MRAYRTASKRPGGSSSTELPKFRDRLVGPLNAQSYRTFLPYASLASSSPPPPGRIPGLKGRRNKFSGDTRLSRSRSRWRNRPTDGRAHRRPRAARALTLGRSRIQLRPKPVCGRDCRPGLPVDRWLANAERCVPRVYTPRRLVFQGRERSDSHRESLLLITREGIPVVREVAPVSSISLPPSDKAVNN